MARLDLIVDPTQAERGFRQASQASERYQRSARDTVERNDRVEGSFQRLSSTIFSLKGAITGAAAALTTGVFASAVRRTLGDIAQLRRSARGLGADIQELQRLQFALGRFGLDDREVLEGINELNDRVQEAINGVGEFQEAFDQAGISIERFGDKAPLERFRRVVNELSRLEDVGQRNSTVIQLLGDEFGNRLVPLLGRGEGALENLLERARELNVALSDDLVNAGAKSSQAISDVREVFDTAFERAVANSAEEFESLADTLNSDDFRVGIENVIKLSTTIVEGLAGSVSVTRQLIQNFKEIAGFEVSQDRSDEADQLRARLQMLQENVGDPLGESAISESRQQRIRDVQQELRVLENRGLAARDALLEIREVGPELAEAQQTLAAIPEDVDQGPARASVDALEDRIASLRDRLKEAQQVLVESLPGTLEPVVNETTALGEETDKAASNTANLADQLGNIPDDPAGSAVEQMIGPDGLVEGLRLAKDRAVEAALELDPLTQAQREFAEQTQIANEALGTGLLTLDEWRRIVMGAEDDLGAVEDRLEGTGNKATEAADDNVDAGGRVAEIWQETARDIQDSFDDTFRDVLDGGISSFANLADRIEDIFKDLLAQLATVAIANPIIIPTVRSIGGTLGLGQDQIGNIVGQLGGGGVGSARLPGGGLTGGFESFATSGLGQSLGLSTTSVPTSDFASTLTAAQQANAAQGASVAPRLTGFGQSLRAGIANLPFAAAGSLAGRELFGLEGTGNFAADLALEGGGGVAGGAIGSSIPALGSAGGPVGAAVGALGGLAIGELLGGLFSDEPDDAELRGGTRGAGGNKRRTNLPGGLNLGIERSSDIISSDEAERIENSIGEFLRPRLKLINDTLLETTGKEIAEATGDFKFDVDQFVQDKLGEGGSIEQAQRAALRQFAVRIGDLSGGALQNLLGDVIGSGNTNQQIQQIIDAVLGPLRELGELDELAELSARSEGPGDFREQARAFIETTRSVNQFLNETRSQEQVLEDTREQVSDFNEEIGRSGEDAIRSTQGLRNFVEGLDLTTEAGQEAAQAALENADAIETVTQARNNLSGSVQQFIRSTETEEESLNRAKDKVSDFNEEIGRSGDNAIRSTSELNAFVDGLDLSTKSGQEAAREALDVADSVRILTQARKEEKQQQQEQIEQRRRAAEEALSGAFESFEQAQQQLGSAIDSRISELQSRREELDSNVQEARERLEQAREREAQERESSLQETISEARQAAEAWRGVVDSVASARQELTVGSAQNETAAVRQQFDSAIQAVFRGDREAAGEIGSQAQALAERVRGQASSQFEARRGVAEIQAQLRSVEGAAGSRASEQDRAARNAEQQLSALESTRDNVVSIEQAQARFEQAQRERDNANLQQQIEQLQTEKDQLSLLDREVSLSEARLAFERTQRELERELETPDLKLLDKNNELLADIRDALSSSSGPGLAQGGIVSGPRSGFQATLHGTEAVIPLNGGSVPVQTDNDNVVRELRSMREELAVVSREQKQESKKMRKILDKFDIDGLPETRSA